MRENLFREDNECTLLKGVAFENVQEMLSAIDPIGDMGAEILEANETGFDVVLSCEPVDPDNIAVVFCFDAIRTYAIQQVSKANWMNKTIHIMPEDIENFMVEGSNGICRLNLLFQTGGTYHYFCLKSSGKEKIVSMRQAFDRREDFYPAIVTFAEEDRTYVITPYYATDRQLSLMRREEKFICSEQFGNTLENIWLFHGHLRLKASLYTLAKGHYTGFLLHYQGQKKGDSERYEIPFSEIQEVEGKIMAKADFDCSGLNLKKAFWDLFCVFEVEGKQYYVKCFCRNRICRWLYRYFIGQSQYLYPYSIPDSQLVTKERAMGNAYKRIAPLCVRHMRIKLFRQRLTIRFSGGFYARKIRNVTVEDVHLLIDKGNDIPLPLNVVNRKRELQKVCQRISAERLIAQEPEVNNPLTLSLSINGIPVIYRLGKLGRFEKRRKASKFFYIPMSGLYCGDYAIFLRRNLEGTYTLVTRAKEAIESDERFLRRESLAASFFMYYMGKIKRLLHRRKINLYFEKYSEKADEGAWEVFSCACGSSKSRNYFILDPDSPEWERRCAHPNVVAKYSRQYYRLLYSSDCFISTETSAHVNVQRSLNHYLRKALLERSLIFLQHGVTYLKRHGKTSVFGKGKEGEPTYMIVGSQKEADIVCEMLGLQPEQCAITGLPIFSTIRFEHITQEAKDVVTIMPTWRLSDEHLIDHFEDSSYFRKTVAIYDMLKRYLPEELICVLPHPKVQSLLLKTRLGERVYRGSVAEALAETKLLVTDYSSVCYNAFYQGAGVCFFQPELAEYEKEVGKLIPTAEEYIGWRTFTLNGLETHIRNGIQNGVIYLSYFRTEEFVRQYRKINNFSDGKNVDRIVAFLQEKNIV